MIARLIDITAASDDGRHRDRGGRARGLMVHRCGVDLKTGVVLGHDGQSVADAFLGRVAGFEDVAAATGGENAYTFLIGGDLGERHFDGKVWQALPLDEVGFHARRFSAPFIGIGLIADPRVRAPSAAQVGTLIELCGELCLGLDYDPAVQIVGHGEVHGAHDGSKASGRANACPGDLLSMTWVREAADSYVKGLRQSRIHEFGIIKSRPD